MSVPIEVASAAEDLLAYVRWLSGLRREALGGVVLCLVPGDDPAFSKVVQVRLAPDQVETTVEAVRARMRSEGRATSTWWLGPSATPPDVEARLRDLGLVPFERATALATFTPPTPGPEGIEVRPLRDAADADSAAEIVAVSFGLDARNREALSVAIREEVDPPVRDSITSFLALMGGRPVGTAASVYLDGCVGLLGGSTLPAARGLGVYRALVRARWDDALERGLPALVTQAVDTTSRPILERLGFVSLFPIVILQDVHR